MIVGVIGSGSIGPDLAYGFLSALAREPATPGSPSKVFLVDIKQAALDAGVARIRGYVEKAVSRGKLAPRAAEGVLAALVPTRNLADLAPCEYVLEAASEDLKIKRAILRDLENVVGADCLIGFATSGLPRAQIAAEARHPDRCFVNHPFFPAWRSLPIEVVLSGDEALGARMMATLKRLGKVPLVTADVACFAADDIFCNYISEAARIVEEGLATPAQVDRIVDDAVGGGGPFRVMDGTRGNALTAHCQVLMQEAPTGGAWFAPPPILTRQGSAPWFEKGRPADPRHDAALRDAVLDRILAVLLGRTYFVVENGICAPTDLDWMTRMALGFRTGLLDLAEELGAPRVAAICRAYADRHPGFAVPRRIAQQDLVSFRRTVRLRRDGDVGILEIFRPEAKNALSDRTMAEIASALEELDGDAAVRGVVLTSWDGALAGADIGGLAAVKTPEEGVALCRRGHAVMARIAAMRKPVVAAVDGPVLGGGAELSMACHARVVGRGLVLGQPEVNLGVIPGYGGTQRLPRLIGVERALDLLRTGRSVGAKEACAWGWATGVPSDDPVAAAQALLRRHVAGELRLATVNPEPVQVPATFPPVDLGHHSLAIDAILVDVIRRGLARPLPEGLEIEAAGFGRCRQTVDMDIGLRNFVQNGPRVPAQFLHE